nr:malectin domain-containing carbohydrate-binding protein [Allomuricauda sp.]
MKKNILKMTAILGMGLLANVLSSQELYVESNAANPTNESDAVTGWTAVSGTAVTSDATESYSGTHSIKITATSDGWRRAYYTFNTKVGAEYNISIYAKSASTEGPGFFQWSGFGDFVGQGITSTDWTEYTFNFTAVEPTASILVYSGNPSLAGNAVYLDNISIIETIPNNATLPLYINAGGSQVTASDGTFFRADDYFLGGTSYTNGSATVAGPYDSERYASAREMYYNIPVPSGNYRVSLHFAEIYYGATGGGSGGVGTRVFDVILEGSLVLDNYDIIADVGSEAPVVKTFDVAVTDGILNLYLTSEDEDGGVNYPKIAAFGIVDLSTIETEPPSQPQLSYATTSTSINLNWSATDNVGVTGYTLKLDGQEVNLTPATTTSHQFTGLTANTDYQISINAYDAAGNIGLATLLTLTTDGSSGSSGSSGGGTVWTETSGDIYYTTGNVGIGTSTIPTAYRLAVNGKIISEEIKVQLQSTWPDYVFEEGYDLPSLKEIQKYIGTNGHLPNIPTAEEVKEKGIEVGEMNRLLLEKIEQLTLYVIQLKNENNVQQEEIEKLKSKSK